MGVWFLSISIGEYLAGAAAQAASVQTVGGQVTNPQLALADLRPHLHGRRRDDDGRGRDPARDLALAQEAHARSEIRCASARDRRSSRAVLLSGCAALEAKPAPARRRSDQRGSLSLDLRPLSGRADGRSATRPSSTARAGRSTTAPSSSPTASSRRSAGRSSPSPAGALEIDGTGKFVTPGIIDVHSHLGDYPSPGGRGEFRRQRGDRPGPSRSLGRAQRLAAGPGLQPRARQWRRDHAADPARLGQSVRRPLGRAEERARRAPSRG